MISSIHVTSLRIDYGFRLLFECLIRSLDIIFFSFLDSLVFCLAQQIMLVLASLGSWLPFAIVALVSLMRRTPFCYLISLLLDSLVCGDLFRGIHPTIPTETQTRLSRHRCLFDFTDHCSSDGQFIADRCNARFIHEEPQWYIQGRRELSSSDQGVKAFSFRNGRRIKLIEITSNAMWKLATMVGAFHGQHRSTEELLLVLYGLIISMAFLVNPFLFFYYEEKEEGDKVSKVRGELEFIRNWALSGLAYLCRDQMDVWIRDFFDHTDHSRVRMHSLILIYQRGHSSLQSICPAIGGATVEQFHQWLGKREISDQSFR